MRTKDQILNLLRDELPFLREKYHVLACGLFGSYSQEEATERSDIDVLVRFERPIGLFKFIELEDYLSLKLGGKVDLVTESALTPLIRHHVMESVAYA